MGSVDYCKNHLASFIHFCTCCSSVVATRSPLTFPNTPTMTAPANAFEAPAKVELTAEQATGTSCAV